jgi:hypothetical protein
MYDAMQQTVYLLTGRQRVIHPSYIQYILHVYINNIIVKLVFAF